MLNSAVLPKPSERLRRWRAPQGAAQALLLAELAQRHSGVVVAVTRDPFDAHQLEADLKVFVGDTLPVLVLPDWEVLPYDLFSPHPDSVAQRIATLNRLPSLKNGVLVVAMPTLLQRLAPRSYLTGTSLVVKVGQKLDIAVERQRLEAAGFRHVGQVQEPGDYAVRGSLLDLFPVGSAEPYRIELFDTEIESIRTFDPENQRSSGQVKRVELLPAREFPFDLERTRKVREALIDRFDMDARRSPLLADLKQQIASPGIEFYLPLFFDHTETLFDYLSGEPLLVLEPGAMEAATHALKQVADRRESRGGDIDRPLLPIHELYLREEELRERLNRCLRIQLEADAELNPLPTQPVPMVPLHQRGAEPAAELKRFVEHYPGRVLLAVDSAGRRESLLATLATVGLQPKSVVDWTAFLKDSSRFALVVAPLSDGFALNDPQLAVIGERQLQGDRARTERRRTRARGRARDPQTILNDLSELSIGSPVVHEDHGVGRYLGLQNMKLGGETGEFLIIEYAGGDKLYVPVSNLHLVGRYTGGAPETAPLHSMGGDAWAKARRRAQEKVRDVAAELLEIYAKRQARPGTSVELDRAMYEQFAADFPFEETPDQAQAIEAVISDLAKPTPMDRVVCGDVGFGKTEVALRAAFVAAQAGLQVAVLVPTTLLAQQHYRNFSDRFADWPIRVELLSRFQSKKESLGALQQIAEGSMDVVVGTHKLLSDDVRFKRLGLIIVDEEQRFGVRQKEQLKKLRAEVDLLTLTATPIPRTLNMSLAGLRDLSIIATPPKHRLAVKTVITQWDEGLLREAFQRELSRGGQVYFLHNEVESIEKAAREISELVPEARVAIAHGQMPASELERVMADFYRQRCNVLVCSTIVENGIDVATANTIIIQRADKFGLSQLHQLRGRVGRSHHRAFAYLIVPDKRSMTADAIKRLEALASLEELGAGFTLATHDLEIRGAGELLGEGQSGQISEVGFTLYTEMLERAVSAIKAGKLPDLDAPPIRPAEIDLHLPALIPEDFLPDVHERLTLYKRVSACHDDSELDDLMGEMIDRFGLLPPQTQNLFAIAKLKLLGTRLGIRKLDLGPLGGRILFNPKPSVDPAKIIQLIQRDSKHVALDGQDKLRLKTQLADAAGRMSYATEVLRRLG